jgi:hypothetical protein
MSFRVIYHEPVCPECESRNVTTERVPLLDFMEEDAYVCGDCGTAWPLACISDLEAQP